MVLGRWMLVLIMAFISLIHATESFSLASPLYRRIQFIQKHHHGITLSKYPFDKNSIVYTSIPKERDLSLSSFNNIHTDPPIAINPTNMLIAVNIITFLLINVNPNILHSLMKIDRNISRGEVYRLLTATFAHQSLYHLFSNCYSLHISGPYVSKIMGTYKFLTIYILSGVFANIFTYYLKSSPYSIGASGSISGLYGAMMIYYWRNQQIMGSRATLPLKRILSSILMSFFVTINQTRIDSYGHLGGVIGGALISFLIGPRFISQYKFGVRRVINAPLIGASMLQPLATMMNTLGMLLSKSPGNLLLTWLGLRTSPQKPASNIGEIIARYITERQRLYSSSEDQYF